MGPVPQAGHRDGHHQVREVGWPGGWRRGGRARGPDSTHQHRADVLSLGSPGSGPGATLLSKDKQADFFFFFFVWLRSELKKKKKSKHLLIEIKRKHAPKE